MTNHLPQEEVSKLTQELEKALKKVGCPDSGTIGRQYMKGGEIVHIWKMYHKELNDLKEPFRQLQKHYAALNAENECLREVMEEMGER